MFLFTVVPAVELFLLLQIGQRVGAWNTFWIVVITGSIGAWLAKREGMGVLSNLQQEAAQGIPASGRLAEGLLVLIGGLLLITPGVFTDITGFLLIIPFSRRLIAPAVVKAISDRVVIGGNVGGSPFPSPNGSATPAGQRGGPKKKTPFSNPYDDL